MALKLPACIMPFFYRLHNKMTGNEIHSLPNDYTIWKCTGITTAITYTNNSSPLTYIYIFEMRFIPVEANLNVLHLFDYPITNTNRIDFKFTDLNYVSTIT